MPDGSGCVGGLVDPKSAAFELEQRYGFEAFEIIPGASGVRPAPLLTALGLTVLASLVTIPQIPPSILLACPLCLRVRLRENAIRCLFGFFAWLFGTLAQRIMLGYSPGSVALLCLHAALRRQGHF